MRCSKCHSVQAPGANFCQHCGAGLGLPRKEPRALKWTLALLLLFVFAGLTVYFFKGILFPFRPVEGETRREATPLPQGSERPAPGRAQEMREAPLAPPVAGAMPAGQEIASSQPAARQSRLLPVGVVAVYDGWGNEIAAISTVVIEQSWAAVPARACFGGVRLIFRFTPSGFSAAIDGGQWRAGDDVVLWHLERPLDIEPVLLQPWQYQGETVWRSLLSQQETADLPLLPDWQQGAWLHAPHADFPDEPGVFLQNGRVTGWTFGGWLAGGYLWAGTPDSSPGMMVTVADFYNITFAGGREEQFVRALAMAGNAGPAARLQVLLAGYLLDPKLDPQDVPDALQPENLLGAARALARELYQQGGFEQLIELLDGEVMRRTGDLGLLKIAADGRIARRGFADALDFVETTRESIRQYVEQAALQDLHLQLYQLWLEDELAQGDLAGAGEALARSRSFFADDPRLFLDGVELALAGGDWAAAEELLWRRVYPDTMADRVDQLARRISQLKMQEGEIVIPFTPGSQQIHVKATVNGRVTYPFLIDTGASVVSIPASLLPALGLELNQNTPRYKVATAGGVKEAWEVTLSSIELEGWLVHNVRALVVDGQEQVDFGLLGLNFLNRFQMHLDSDAGVLILNPQ